MLCQFHEYNNWVGFFDIDEFFLPTQNLRNVSIHQLLTHMDEQANQTYVVRFPEKPQTDAVWFNSVEMHCANQSHDFIRTHAKSTHCFIEGGRFFQIEVINGNYYSRWKYLITIKNSIMFMLLFLQRKCGTVWCTGFFNPMAVDQLW